MNSPGLPAHTGQCRKLIKEALGLCWVANASPIILCMQNQGILDHLPLIVSEALSWMIVIEAADTLMFLWLYGALGLEVGGGRRGDTPV